MQVILTVKQKEELQHIHFKIQELTWRYKSFWTFDLITHVWWLDLYTELACALQLLYQCFSLYRQYLCAFKQQQSEQMCVFRARGAAWQVTGETRSCFQGQCCDLQVKRQNSTPVCVCCCHVSPILSLSLYPCCHDARPSYFVNCLCVYISPSVSPPLPLSLSTSCSPRRAGWGGTQACSEADSSTNKAHSVMKPNFRAGTMLGSPNSLSLRQTEPRLTSQSPGEAAPKLPAPPQETQAQRPGANPSSQKNIRLPLKGPELRICYCCRSCILFIPALFNTLGWKKIWTITIHFINIVCK